MISTFILKGFRTMSTTCLDGPEILLSYSSHGWNTALSSMANPSSAHTIIIDGIKEAIVNRYSTSNQNS
jgi:hypothetical protein